MSQTQEPPHTTQTALESRSVYPPSGFDLNRYRAHLADFNLTEDEQTELLSALWHIMASFADLSFTTNPITTSQITCGQLLTTLFCSANVTEVSVKCTQDVSCQTPNTASADSSGMAGEVS